MKQISMLTASLVLFALLPINASSAADAPKVTYAEHVRPIFREHCFNCHNQNKKQNDLALDSFESLMAGGAAGAAVKPGDPDDSYLWALVSHKDTPHMPPNSDKLVDAKLDVIKQWIAGGALKDSGSSAAAVTQKPTVDLSQMAGAAKPEGPPPMPEGVPKEPVVKTARPAAVTALAASPWAPLVAVAGQKQIAFYNTDSGDLLGILPFPEGIAYSLKFSRSGTLLVAGGGRGAAQGLAAVYDVKTGKRAFTVGDELDAVLAADIDAQHTKVAVGGPQRLVRVFQSADGSLVYELKKHTDWITSLEFSPDGVLLATADRAGGVAVWEAQTGREFFTLDGHKEPVTDVSWRADGNVLATASQDGSIKLWNMEDGKQIKSITAHGGGVTSIQFTHDGRLVSCGRDKLVKTWDAAGKTIRQFEALPDIALKAVYTHDGKRVAAGDWSGEVRLWEEADGKQVARLPASPGG